MPNNVYECMFMLDPSRVAGDIPGAAKQIHTILERHSAEILASRPWDERKLCYSVKGQKKGLFYLTYFRTDGKNLAKIERDVELNETILRSLVIRIDPKHVETMLAIGRDEHALALQVAPEIGTEGDAPISETDDARDHRRGRRGGSYDRRD